MRQPKGEYGYIRSQKKVYGMLSLICAALIIVLYIITNFILEGNVLLIVTVLLALPLAQFLVKYVLYRQYRETEESIYRKIEGINDRLVCLGSLIVVRGKVTLFYEAAIVTDQEVVLLIAKQKERKDILFYKENMEKLIRPKGYNAKISVYNDSEAMYNYVCDLVPGINKINTDEQIELAEMILGQSI